jgi:erythromycin esterase
MSRLSRRSLMLASAALPFAPSAWAEDTLDQWLGAHSVRIRTVELAGDDFSDLEPVARAIGNARVVQLGEPSHGGGTGFAAKARLVKFLHQRMGFDLLIWESGLYDVWLADAAMRGSEDGVAAARKGVFALWTEARELAPFFAYIKSSQAGPKPIAMAGFDMQVTADGSMTRFAADLRALAAGARDAALRDQASGLAEAAIAARARLFATKFANQADLDALDSAATGLANLVTARRADFAGANPTLMERAIQNMRADAAQRFSAARGATDGPRESRRDAANADNLRWLLQSRYPGRKAILWAHNAHVMHAFYARDFHNVHLTGQPGDMKPTGIFMADWLGDRLYTIGITAYDGQEGFATGGPVTAIAPAPEGTLEARLHGLNLPFAFVDLRGTKARRPAIGAARAPKFDSVTVPDISAIYDGIFFIDHMAPATRA